jgi:hypothetical protein
MTRTDCIDSGQHGTLLAANVYHAAPSRCADERAAISRFEAQAEGAWLRAAESAGMDEDLEEQRRGELDELAANAMNDYELGVVYGQGVAKQLLELADELSKGVLGHLLTPQEALAQVVVEVAVAGWPQGGPGMASANEYSHEQMLELEADEAGLVARWLR